MKLPDREGVYIYREGDWIRVSLEGPYVPDADGIYVLYFRNFKCSGCRAFDNTWLKFVYEQGSIYNFVMIQCSNFFFECNDVAASDSFVFYLIFETPQVLIVVVENGIPIYIEREVGVLSLETLRDFVFNVRDRMSRVQVEEEEGLKEEEGIYIDFASKNWKEITEKLKKIIYEGRIPREVCTEYGCRIVIE
jgi:hypothetical protein